MKTFEIYQGPAGEIEAVKQGFSWPAVFFGCLWAFSHRLWGVGAALLVIRVIIEAVGLAIERSDNSGAAMFFLPLTLLCSAFVGSFANSWRTTKLRSKRYQIQGRVRNASAEAAVEKYRLQHSPDNVPASSEWLRPDGSYHF